MVKKVFVGGLPWESEAEDLKAAFEQFGEVVEAKVVTDRDTGRSRGFGFVTFANENAAAEALRVEKLQMGSRMVHVHEANDQGSRGRR